MSTICPIYGGGRPETSTNRSTSPIRVYWAFVDGHGRQKTLHPPEVGGKKLCLAGGADIKNTTFFFGLAADAVPMAISAQIFSIGTPPLYNVDARVPVH